MKSVVFHVGAHKTGTSLLQKYMRDNVRSLKARHVYYLARSEMNDLVGWGGNLADDPTRLRRRIQRVLLNPWYRTLVTSHENTLGKPVVAGAHGLYPDTKSVADLLADTLRGWRVRILFYIRPQEEFLESYYLQLIHQGRHFTFQEWLEGVDLDAVSWWPAVEALRDAFGEERVAVVGFDTIREGQNAFIRDFLRRVHPALDGEVEYRPVRNPSVGDKGLRLALEANKHLKGGAERAAMRKFLQRQFSNRKYPRPVLLTEPEKAHLRERYSTEYQKLTGSLAGLPA